MDDHYFNGNYMQLIDDSRLRCVLKMQLLTTSISFKWFKFCYLSQCKNV